jgi:hypothetical protein
MKILSRKNIAISFENDNQLELSIPSKTGSISAESLGIQI